MARLRSQSYLLPAARAGEVCSINAAGHVELSQFTVKNSSGTGIRIQDSSLTLKQCVISGNSGVNAGGVYVSGSSQVAIQNCVIASNGTSAMEAGAGGILVTGGASMTMQNCIMHDNTTTFPSPDECGAACVCDGTLSIVNSTIVQNGKTEFTQGDTMGSGALDIASGMSCDGGTITVDSSIVFNNVTYQIGSSVTVSYSDVQGGFAGTGNISNNPLFADSSYHLLDGASPCIDTGNPDTSQNDGCLPPGLGQSLNDMGAYGGPLNCNW